MRPRAIRSAGVALALAAALGWGCRGVPTGAPTEVPSPEAGASPQEVAAFHLVEDGRQQLADGRTASAVATFSKALALAPSSPHANLALAQAKVEQGDYRAAIVYADRVARLTGEQSDWFWRSALVRARAFEGMGDAARAIQEYRRVIERDPGNSEARAGLARVESAQPLR